ncbi:anoctamin-9 [Salminus brasiliensis]|uniref:anoctamin-9 n=1 Tax=Salminus brasiliensis TaxID=930266 RepID=UPI003B82EDBE
MAEVGSCLGTSAAEYWTHCPGSRERLTPRGDGVTQLERPISTSQLDEPSVMARKLGHKRTGSIELLEAIGVVKKDNGSGSFSLLPVSPQSFDYVLVAQRREDEDHESFRKQRDFINALKAKDLTITKIIDNGKIFYGIIAPKVTFETYTYLLKVSDACNWSCEQQGKIPQSTRIRIVDFIVDHTSIDTVDGPEYLSDLIKKNVFEAQFCLHEKQEQKELRNSWARWTACFNGQPITDVRAYFGEKVALYFLWLGWYTFLLIPAAVLGVIVFLYGLAFFKTNPLIKEVCESDTIMCPLCDNRCKVWQLSDTCIYAKVSILFDNEGTVAFAMFMAVWATVFLEFWKRHRASYVSEWKVFDWCEEEEELILDIVNNPNCESKKHSHSYLRSTLVMVLVTLMLMLIIGLAQALVVFRVIASEKFAKPTNWAFLRENSSTVAFLLGAVLHYLTITIMTRVNRTVAMKLCELEKVRSHAAVERSFTVKMFVFQFFTLFSSLIYTAFFLGRINGHPGGYVRIAGIWRLEECHPSGCLTDLFIQMAVILILKQTINNVVEISGPWFARWWKRLQSRKLRQKVRQCSKKDCMEGTLGAELCENCKVKDLLRNFDLDNVDQFSLFNEFLEMVLQFSFTTIFVAAFPLAPLLALLNNIIEIRLDAIKMVSLERRLVPKKTNDIGIWTDVLETIGVLAVIANGLVIGISSDFIPRLVYRYRYGPCANSNVSDIDCMSGYINNTLSIANISHENIKTDFSSNQLITSNNMTVTYCSYRDYRSNEDYSLTNQFWVIQAIRFAFVVLFEHVVVMFKFIAGWFVPGSPLEVKNNRLQDKLVRLKEELSAERNRHAKSQNK